MTDTSQYNCAFACVLETRSKSGKLHMQLKDGREVSLHVTGLLGGGTDFPQEGELVELSLKDGRPVSGRRVTWPRVGRRSSEKFRRDLRACVQLSPDRAREWAKQMSPEHWGKLTSRELSVLLDSSHPALRKLAVRNSHHVSDSIPTSGPLTK